MSFLAHVFGWFTTSANWSGSQGIPILFWNQIKLVVAVVATAVILGGALGVVLGHTGRGGSSPSTPRTRSAPSRRSLS